MSDETKPDQLPMIEDETTDLLDAATDFLVDSAIPVPFWKNAAKALRQLSTAAIEWPAAYFEGKTAEIRAGTEARIKITENITTQIAQQMEVDSEYARTAVKKYGKKILREQVNLNKVSAAAINELEKSESDGSTDQSTDSNEEKTISDDFLNSFEEEARQKDTKEMQLLFGRILAGEISQPGSYSIRAVKILGQLDQKVATLFKKLCSICTVLEFPNSKYVIKAKVLSLGGNAGTNALSEYGLNFDQLNILNEYGLIDSHYNYLSTYDVIALSGNRSYVFPFRYQGRYWALFTLPGWNKDQKQFQVSGVMLSQVGRELFPIVDLDPVESYTEDLKKFFARQHLEMLEFNRSSKI